MNTRSIFLFFLIVGMLLCGSASATSSDFFDESPFNTTRWHWQNSPTHSYDVDTTLADYLYVNTTNSYNPDEVTNLALNGMTYVRQNVSDSEFNVSMSFDSVDYLPNTAATALILENGTSDYLAIVVKRNFGNRYIRFNTIESGARTQNNLSGAIAQATTGDLEIKFQVYDDGGVTKINTFYILDDGTEVQQGNGYVSPFSSFSYVGQVYGSDDANGGDIYTDYFSWNAEEPPVDPYANIELTDGTPGTIDLNDVNINISALYDYIVDQKGSTSTEDDYIVKVDSDTYHIKARFLSNSTGSLIADSMDIRFSNEVGPGYNAIETTASFTNCTVRCWNATTDSETPFGFRKWWFGSNSSFVDVTFDTFRLIAFDGTNITLDGVYMTNWLQYISFNGNNFSVTDLDMVDVNTTWLAGQAGIDYSTINDSVLTNIYVNPYLTFEKPVHDSTHSYGFHADGRNSTVTNMMIKNTVYSGLVWFGSNSTFENITVDECEHNAIEIRTGATGIVNYNVFDSITVTGGNGTGIYDSAILYGADDLSMTGNAFRNVTLDHDGTGGSLKIGGGNVGIYDTIFENITVLQDPIYILDNFHNSTWINSVISGSETGYSIQWTQLSANNTNNRFINCTFEDGQLMDGTRNLVFANCAGIDTYVTFDDSNYIEMYPLNARVLNTTGTPIENAYLNFTSNATVIDEDGNVITSILTGSDGRPLKRIHIADFNRDSGAGYTNYTVDVNVSKDGESDSELGIDPNSSWYSPNISDLQGPLYTFVLDVEGTGESIYFTGDTAKNYMNYPSKFTWTVGAFVKTFPLDGTILLENAPAEIKDINITAIGTTGFYYNVTYTEKSVTSAEFIYESNNSAVEQDIELLNMSAGAYDLKYSNDTIVMNATVDDGRLYFEDAAPMPDDTYTIESQKESFVNPVFVAVAGAFAGAAFVISSWINRRRKRW